MKVLAINGSPRKDGNTAILIQNVLNELENEGIKTEFVQFAGKSIRGCNACYICKEKKNKKCAIDNDIVNELIEKIIDADALILGSPTYFSNITAEMKAFIDRTGVVARANDFMFKRKMGVPVIAMRRAGAVMAFNAINHFFLANQMIVPGSSYWNLGMGGAIGTVQEDEEGLQNMCNLGNNLAWTIKKLQ
jgi:multimeric flavodoxin WrbA